MVRLIAIITWLVVGITIVISLADVVNATPLHSAIPLVLSLFSMGMLMTYYSSTRTLLRRHKPKGFLQQDHTLLLTVAILLVVGMQTARLVILAYNEHPHHLLAALPFNVLFSMLILFLTFIEGRFTHYEKRFSQAIRFNSAFGILRKRGNHETTTPSPITQGPEHKRHHNHTQAREQNKEAPEALRKLTQA